MSIETEEEEVVADVEAVVDVGVVVVEEDHH